MPSKPKLRGLTLQGLSQADRDLMLAMMAALGSNATVLLATSQSLTKVSETASPDQKQGWVDAAAELDQHVNSNIDLIKACKARLQPEAILRLN